MDEILLLELAVLALAVVGAWTVGKRMLRGTNGINPVDRHRIRQAMKALLATTEVKRAILLKVENGGGTPRDGGDIYATEVISSTKPPAIAEEIYRVKLDENAKQVLVTAREHGHVNIDVESMETGMLKGIYLGANVKFVVVFFLGISRVRSFYLSVGVDDEGMIRFLSEKEQAKIRLTRQAIQRMLKKYAL